jgi:hypothetical protein
MSQKTSISIATATVDRTGRRVLTLLLPIIVAAICLWMAMPHTAPSRGVASSAVAVSSGKGFQPANQSTLQAATVAPTAIPVSLPAASPKLITRPIEDICPGMRVLASNPEETESLADSDVTAEDWRLVSLTMTKEEGGTLRVQLLRPIEWLVTEAVILIADADDPQSLFVNVPSIPAAPDTEDYKLQRLLLGQTIHLDLPELGAQGPAMVTAIDPCPPLDKPQPGRRMVTGAFRHSAANVVDLQVGSESESFGVTDNHPFWSVDRGEFVEAGLLRIGEQLQCADGTITQVTRITPRRGPPVEVYNFEVDAEHVYHVGTSGVLVHNACHGYAIFNRVTGEVYKFGVSRRGFTNGGLSQRAQAQLTKIANSLGLTRDDLSSVVLRKFGNSADMFKWEQEVVGIWRAMGNLLPKNIRPKGVNPFNIE